MSQPAKRKRDATQAEPFRGLAFTLSSLGYAIGRRFKTTLAPFELEPREFALLRAVAADEGQSQHALGERLQIPRSRMVAIVDQLEERSLLERRASLDDRRVRLLHLTDVGRELVQQAFARAIEFEHQVGEPLAPDEREHLLDLLDRVSLAIGLTTGGAHAALQEPDETDTSHLRSADAHD